MSGENNRKEAENQGQKGLFGEEFAGAPATEDYADEIAVMTQKEDDGQDDQPLLALSPVALDRSETVRASLRDLLPYIDELDLFEKRWGFDKGAASRDEWCRWAQAELVPVFNNLVAYCERENIYDLRASFVYTEAAAQSETLFLYKGEASESYYAHVFPREKNGRCVTDKFCGAGVSPKDTAALILATCGQKAQATARKWKMNGKTADYKYLHGLSQEITAALTRYTENLIHKHGACVGGAVRLADKSSAVDDMQILLSALNASAAGVTINPAGILSPEYAAVYLVPPR